MILKIIFLSTMLVAVAGCLARFWRMRKWDEINAQIKDLIDDKDGESGPSPVIEYEYQGRHYISYKKSEHISRNNKAGNLIRICINPRNHKDFIVENWSITALLFLICGSISVFLLVNIIKEVWY